MFHVSLLLYQLSFLGLLVLHLILAWWSSSWLSPCLFSFYILSLGNFTITASPPLSSIYWLLLNLSPVQTFLLSPRLVLDITRCFMVISNSTPLKPNSLLPNHLHLNLLLHSAFSIIKKKEKTFFFILVRILGLILDSPCSSSQSPNSTTAKKKKKKTLICPLSATPHCHSLPKAKLLTGDNSGTLSPQISNWPHLECSCFPSIPFSHMVASPSNLLSVNQNIWANKI